MRQRRFVIAAKQLDILVEGKNPEAVLLRTISNAEVKLVQNWSNMNPPYLEEVAAKFIAAK